LGEGLRKRIARIAHRRVGRGKVLEDGLRRRFLWEKARGGEGDVRSRSTRGRGTSERIDEKRDILNRGNLTFRYTQRTKERRMKENREDSLKKESLCPTSRVE